MRRWIKRAFDEVERSFSETHSPHQIAASFAIGVFITMLPTLGVGLLVFVVLAYLFTSINRVALFSSVIVFNPVVKWGVYAASLTIGFIILGPVEGGVTTANTLEGGQELIVRLLVGNLILAVIATVLGYVVVYRLAARYQREARVVVETVIEEIEEELI